MKRLNLTSDVFFKMVMKDVQALVELLRILTGRRYRIVRVGTDQSICRVFAHAVVLDVYAETAEGGVVHLEMQRKNSDNHVKRNRYYRACMDCELLGKGARYAELPDVLQIFITEKDFLQCGRALLWNRKTVDDGSVEVYFNLASWSEQEKPVLRKLQKYFLSTEGANGSADFPEIVRRVRYLKEEEGGWEEMCQVSEYFIEMGKKEGRNECYVDAILSLMETLKCTAQEAVLALKIPEKESGGYLREVQKRMG